MGQLTIDAGCSVTRRAASASTIVLGHSTVSSSLTDTGELLLAFRPKKPARFLSEHGFRREVGISPSAGVCDRPFSSDQIQRHSSLNAAQLRSLAFYDVLNPLADTYSYSDLVIARAVARLMSTGAKFPAIVVAALALDHHGSSLSSVRLAEAPWGELLQEVDGVLAQLDGQLLLPLDGQAVGAEDAFARAESSEQDGNFEDARRWYELAMRLDEKDATIPFNLGNVLDALGLAQDAEIAYRQALARSSDLADAWFNLGVLKEKAGREEEAIFNYKAAVAVEPTYTDALHNAALLLMRRKRFEEALPIWTKIAETVAASAEEARRLAHLCRLEMRHKSVES
jgi:tetratricopeptide (TPR) repeat protein